MLPKKLTFVDVETSGTSFNHNRVIEIGIIQTEDGKVTKEFSTLVNPQQHVSTEILNMTNISLSELEKAPSFREVFTEVDELLKDSVFVAHNVGFDYGFIKNEYKLLEKSYSAKCLCTVKLSRAFYPEYKSHNLDSIIKRFGFNCENRHRALDDARVLVDFVRHITHSFEDAHIEKVLNRLLKRPSTPVGVTDEILDNLPETPGVYIFYGSTGIPLYIGKSINIKNRVLSHFSSATISSSEMEIAAQVRDIETLITDSELSALLKEADLIKSMQPLYNRQLRSSSTHYYLSAKTNEHGYKVPVITKDPPAEILGIFKSQKQANETLFKLSEEHKLCKKLLGLEKNPSGCFGYQLGKCAGACVNEENPILYNLRFDTAFVATKIKAWPFNGPILIEDGEDKFIIDNWRYFKLDPRENYDLDTLAFPVTADPLDLDTYKILNNYIYSSKNQRKITVLSRH